MKKLLFLFSAFVLSASAHAADLTEAQKAAIKADVLADSILSQLQPSPDNAYVIADEYAKAPAVPCVVWRTTLTPAMSRAAIIIGATQVDGLAASKRDTLFWLVGDTLNPSDSSVRAALDDVTGSQATLKAAIQAAQKRNANRLEKLLSTTGLCSTVSPSTMTFEGQVTYQQVMQAMGW